MRVYFYIAKEFVRDNIDIDILEELLSLGGLGIQYCIKTEKAYANLREIVICFKLITANLTISIIKRY